MPRIGYHKVIDIRKVELIIWYCGDSPHPGDGNQYQAVKECTRKQYEKFIHG